MSIRLGISVEGQTEERFVKDLLAPHLVGFGVYATPIVVTTSRSASGQKAKGGGINGETVDHLETRIAASLDTPRNLIAYVQLHEFEGLLLSDAAITATYFDAPAMEPLIRQAISSAGSPEAVNQGMTTAPSKRLEAWTRQLGPTSRFYSKGTKTLHGPRLAARLTLPVIRAACQRFSRWLSKLEALART